MITDLHNASYQTDDIIHSTGMHLAFLVANFFLACIVTMQLCKSTTSLLLHLTSDFYITYISGFIISGRSSTRAKYIFNLLDFGPTPIYTMAYQMIHKSPQKYYICNS